MAKLLLIEDDERTRILISSFLQHHGHEVLLAQDGAFGVSMTTLEVPDMILLDLMMPVMSGKDALTILKNQPVLKDIPVVVVSAALDSKLEHELLGQGVVACLDKPLDLQELLHCVQGVLTFRTRPN